MPSVKMSRLEIDIRRLLTKCEEMAKAEDLTENWRLPKFIETSENMLKDLKKGEMKAEKENLDLYLKRITFLKGLLEAKKMESTLQKSFALQMLAPPNSSDTNHVKEIYRKNLAECESNLRQELMQDPNEIRRRLFSTEPSGSQELDTMLKFHSEKHEQIADDMLIMTRSMREQSELAGQIIREDMKNLEKSAKIMDDNYFGLQRQSNRLQDFISKSGWRCWIWIILAIIIIIFLNMIFFMKIAKKKY